MVSMEAKKRNKHYGMKLLYLWATPAELESLEESLKIIKKTEGGENIKSNEAPEEWSNAINNIIEILMNINERGDLTE